MKVKLEDRGSFMLKWWQFGKGDDVAQGIGEVNNSPIRPSNHGLPGSVHGMLVLVAFAREAKRGIWLYSNFIPAV